MIYSYNFGHKTIFINGKWVYADNKKNINTEKRKCPRCGKYKTQKGHDPCIKNLKNIKNACCGHGVSKGYKN